jgi:hypothetical protein
MRAGRVSDLDFGIVAEGSGTPSARSLSARHAASEWLFKTRNRKAQDLRLRIRIERDAFARMARARLPIS